MTDDFELPTVAEANPDLPGTMELGAFSISLTVASEAAKRRSVAK